MGTDLEALKDLLQEMFQEYEKEFGISKEAFINLISKNDWTFVIQIHTIIEATINYSITKKLPKLEKFFYELQFYDKLTIAKQLQLISEKDFSFAKNLSNLRNKIVHKVSNINFNFDDVKEEDLKAVIKSLCKSIGVLFINQTYNSILEDIKTSILHATVSLMIAAYSNKLSHV